MHVVLDGREGHGLFVRELDPGDEVQPFELDPAADEIVVMTAISAAFLCASSDVGADDALTHPLRVVPDARDGSNVFMRTLRHGEADDGRRVHVRPGESPVFRAGSLVIELDSLDEHFTLGLQEYAPLANTVWTWPTITGKGRGQARGLYVLAAARRLDGAAVAWTRSKELLRSTATVAEGSFNPQVRAAVFELIACVELASIALQRVVRMVEQALEDVGADTPVPEIVTRLGLHSLRFAMHSSISMSELLAPCAELVALRRHPRGTGRHPMGRSRRSPQSSASWRPSKSRLPASGSL